MRRRPKPRALVARAALVAVAVAFAVAALVTSAASSVAWAPGAVAAVRAPATEPLPPPSTSATATVPGDESGIGELDAGSNTPSPRGEPEPPRAQRVADTAIFVGLLVVFAAGVGVAIWSVRRTRPAA